MTALSVAAWTAGETIVSTDSGTAIESDMPPAAARRVTVFVSGAVSRPGAFSLDSSDTTEAALLAAGGLLPQATLAGVDRDKVVSDGMNIHVPERAGSGGSAELSAEAESHDKVSINGADERELDTLPGIGPVMAKRIVEYRTQNGSFKTLEDIKRVRGIGASKFRKIKDRIRL